MYRSKRNCKQNHIVDQRGRGASLGQHPQPVQLASYPLLAVIVPGMLNVRSSPISLGLLDGTCGSQGALIE